MLLHDHPGFQSDIALLLETIGASLIVGKTSCYTRRRSWYLVRACLHGGVVLQVGNSRIHIISHFNLITFYMIGGATI